jgi:hypothetical protein
VTSQNLAVVAVPGRALMTAGVSSGGTLTPRALPTTAVRVREAAPGDESVREAAQGRGNGASLSMSRRHGFDDKKARRGVLYIDWGVRGVSRKDSRHLLSLNSVLIQVSIGT